MTDIYDEIADDTVDYVTDSNNDGISDYFTKLLCDGTLVNGTGAPIFEGISYEDLQSGDDYDNDGLSNGEEIEIIFNEETGQVYVRIYSLPVELDSDQDGLGDLDEYFYGTDPLNWDSDGDGLDDGTEIANWFDPLNVDPDGDGIFDLTEYENGTDPYCYNESWPDYVFDFLEGLFAGDFIEETDSLVTMMGQVISGLVPLADVRDVIANLIHGDYVMAGLNLIGSP